MGITHLTHSNYYCSAESFCICGRTIFQYIDFDGKKITYRENWNTPVGWFHKSDKTFKCGDDFVQHDKDFPIKHFKNYLTTTYEMKAVELLDIPV
jgi:hypothetical protein